MIFGTGIRSLCLTLSAVCLTLLAVPAYASQSPEAVQRAASEVPSVTPVPEVQLTTEQRVDRIFGVVVEQMVKVLFWDVAFWDNNAALTVSEPFAERYPLLLADPLGWEIAAFGESGGQSFSKSLEPKVEYAFEGRATVGTYTADGLTLYVGTDRGEIVHFSREGGQGKSLYQGKGAITRIVLHPNGTGIWAGDAGGQLVEIPSTDSEPNPITDLPPGNLQHEFPLGTDRGATHLNDHVVPTQAGPTGRAPQHLLDPDPVPGVNTTDTD